MHRHIYISRALISDRAALDAIIATSVARNSGVGLTGELWFDGTSFAQVLEGDRLAIRFTMDRVRADTRHTDIEVVSDREIRHAMFNRWSMKMANEPDNPGDGTAFLVGFAKSERGELAQRLYRIAIASADMD